MQTTDGKICALRRYDDVDYYYKLRTRRDLFGNKVYYMAREPKVGADDGTHTKVIPYPIRRRNKFYWMRFPQRTDHDND